MQFTAICITAMQMTRSPLLHGVGARLGALGVMLAEISREANSANDLAVDDQRDTALDRHRSLQAEDAETGATTSQRILESLGGALEERGRAGLVDRHLGAA